MEKDIVDGKIGEFGAYDVEFKEGALKAKANISAMAGPVEIDGQLTISLGAKALGDAIKKAIPGQVDDAIIDLMVGALLAKQA